MSVNIATHDKPCASPNLQSFRYRGRYGWIMIGAHDALDALREASRSTGGNVTLRRLQEWDGEKYIPIERCKESDLDRGAMESKAWYDTSAELT